MILLVLLVKMYDSCVSEIKEHIQIGKDSKNIAVDKNSKKQIISSLILVV